MLVPSNAQKLKLDNLTRYSWPNQRTLSGVRDPCTTLFLCTLARALQVMWKIALLWYASGALHAVCFSLITHSLATLAVGGSRAQATVENVSRKRCLESLSLMITVSTGKPGKATLLCRKSPTPCLFSIHSPDKNSHPGAKAVI
jgi:hypothetical protein